MTYIAFNRLQKQRAAQRTLGLGVILHVAVCGGCAARSFGDGDETCAEYACVPDASKLSVVFVTPTDGATNADPSTTIGIEFSRELDPASVSPENIMVTDGDTPVSGTLRCDGRHVAFTPRAKLSLLARYAVVVRSTVSDIDGSSMKHDFRSVFAVRDGSWTRTTNPSANHASLSGLTVDVNGHFVLGLSEGAPSARRYSAGAWSEPIPVAGEGSFDFLLRGNGRGDALAVAVDPIGGATARQLHEGNWQTQSTQVAVLTGYLPQLRVAAAVAPNGDAHLLFVDDQVIRTKHTDSFGNWSDGVSTVMTDTMHYEPVVAFDGRGDGFAAWVAYDEAHGRSGVHVMRISTGSTGSVEAIPNSFQDGQSLGKVALGMTLEGAGVAVWPGRDGLLTSDYTGQAWSSARFVADTANAPVCVVPTVVNDGDDWVAAWGQDATDSPTRCAIYSSRWHDRTWSAPELLGNAVPSSTTPPLLAADTHGNLMLAWNTETIAKFARFNFTAHRWTTPSTVLDVPTTATNAIAVASNGAVMAAFELDGEVATALFE